MNQSIFKSRVLLVATALAAAGVVSAQSTYTPATTSTATASPPLSTSSAPCNDMEGAALSECLKNNPASARPGTSASTGAPRPPMSGDTSANASASASKSTDSRSSAAAGGSKAMDNNKSVAAKASTSTDTSTSMSAGSSTAATHNAAAKPKAASASANPEVSSATPGNNARTQNKTAARSNPADTRFRAELRNCVQQSGDQRETCLDRAIESHQQS